MIGNSSAGIHEAPVMGLTSVNIGSRQQNRFLFDTIINCTDDKKDILISIEKAKTLKSTKKTNHFGNGSSSKGFHRAITDTNIWKISRQKIFCDIDNRNK